MSSIDTEFMEGIQCMQVQCYTTTEEMAMIRYFLLHGFLILSYISRHDMRMAMGY